MKICNASEEQKPAIVLGQDCVPGEVYRLSGGSGPRFCVQTEGKNYMVNMVTGIQSGKLSISKANYVRLPDACISTGEEA